MIKEISIEKMGKNLSDKELYEKCREYGGNAREWSRKFAALLPEVERRQLYKKHGFYSISEFAAKLAGMNHETVVDILRVAQRLEDKPLLAAQMESQGWSKLKVVATIATKENERILAEKVKEMSQVALKTFVQEIKKQNPEIVQNRVNPDISSERIFIRIPLSPHNELRLKELQKKISHERKAPVDLNEVVETLLDAYEKKSAPAKNVGASSPPERELNLLKKEVKEELKNKAPSRYIPAKVKKVLHAEYGGRCAFDGCTKLPEIYHHTRRFSLNPSHDPDFLMPLCKGHERLAHLGLIENEEKLPSEWSIKIEADKSSEKYWIDQKVNAMRKLL